MSEKMTLPAKHYTDPDYFKAEMERIYFKKWICVGREEQIAKPGSYFLRQIGNESLILTKDDSGKPQAFFNVCRHRGTQLCDKTEGTFKGRIQCPYHAWTYALDGRLVGAPHMDEVAGFSMDRFPLHRLSTDTWEGNLWVNFTKNPRPLWEQLGPIAEKFRAWRGEDLKLGKRVTYEVKANWKLLIQNYSECLHCPVIHPALKKLSNYMSGDNEPYHPNYLGGSMRINDGVTTMTHSGQTTRAILPHLDEKQRRHVYYYWITPNLLLSTHPDYIMTHTLWPKRPDLTEVICELHFHPDEMKKPGFSAEDASLFWDEVNREDWHVSELSQLGISSRAYSPGPYSNRETLLHGLDLVLARRDRGMSRKVVVIGAGINGLVAANYLRRAGCDVLMLEKKDKVGGACTMEWFDMGGQRYALPTGASVFGMMQDFVFDETGLANRVSVYHPKHPGMVYFGKDPSPMSLHDDAEAYATSARERWNERGNIVGYGEELSRVRDFLLDLYRRAETPSLDKAREVLGEETTKRWITGSASALFKHYFTSDKTKIFKSMSVTESGPVDLDNPSTAFNIALMSAGSVSEGHWGFVNGALWQVPLALTQLNAELGVEILTSVQVQSVVDKEVTFTRAGKTIREKADAIFFATDPLTAARLLGDKPLLETVSRKHYLGSSGKVVMVFREPVAWKGDTGNRDYHAAFRYVYDAETLAAFEESNRAVREKRVDYSPCAFQIYAEGANMRQMGWKQNHDYFSVFFKDLALTKPGRELPEVKKYVETRILSMIANPDALVGSVLFTPKDLQESFFFPEGNIDHMELREGQNFFARTFSSQPKSEFYRFGSLTDVYYCGAAGFPCGSVAGTVGYLAAKQWLRSRV